METRDETRTPDPTINEVFAEFLEVERRRLGDVTFRKYENVIDLLALCLDGYAFCSLAAEEREKFERICGAERESDPVFTEVFGPEHILPNVGEFLGYFMVRKVSAGKDLLRTAGTVTKRLARWLAAREYASVEDAADAAERGATAARDLPAAEELARLLDECSEQALVFAETVEDHFTFTHVEGGTVRVEDSSGREYGPICLPVPVAGACPVGWTFSGMIGRRGRYWFLGEVWNVYP